MEDNNAILVKVFLGVVDYHVKASMIKHPRLLKNHNPERKDNKSGKHNLVPNEIDKGKGTAKWPTGGSPWNNEVEYINFCRGQRCAAAA